MSQGIAELRATTPHAPAMRHRLAVDGRRLTLLLSGSSAIVAVVVLAIVLAGRSGVAPPAEGAAQLVPADALAYIHVSTDPRRPADRQALALAERLPGFARLTQSVTSRVAAIAGGSARTSFDAQIRPWLGREAALAFLDTPTATADSLVVLDVRGRSLARAFVARAGAVNAGGYRGTPLLRNSSGTELAFAKHYLVLGQDAAVRASIDALTGAGGSLASSNAYRRAVNGQPADRVVEAYASGSGLPRVLGAQHNVLGALLPLLSSPALRGVSVALSPTAEGASVRVHSVLDPELARLGGRTTNSFVPTLTHVIPAGSPFVLDLRGLDRAAPRLLAFASALGIGTQIRPLLQRLGSALAAEGVNVPALESIFDGEAAVAATPAPVSGRPPSLTILARTTDPARASELLASLEAPLAQLFAPAAEQAGQAPVFGERQVAGITAHVLSLTPGLQLDYAVFRGLVVISTSLDGIAAIATARHAVTDEQEFRAAFTDRPERLGSLLFFDFSQLLSFGEQTGITRSQRLAALLPDLRRIRAVGLSSTGGEDDSTAELSLQIP